MLRSGMEALEVLLLGVAVVSDGGGAIRLQAKLTALSAYVTMRGGAQRAEVAEVLWGAGARHNLRVALHQLRRSLPHPGALVTSTGQQRIALVAACDAVRFERAVSDGRFAEAVGAWQRGAAGRHHRDVFMAGFHLPSTVGFQDWMEQERARLGALYLRALWHLAETAEGARDPDAAVAWLRVLLEEDPLDERAHRRVMRIALARGDAATALDQYDTCRRVLRADLDVEPSAATTVVAEQARRASRRAFASAAAGPAPSATASGPAGRLIGREEALVHLETLLPTASPLSIVGPGGVGKSRLAAALAARVRHRYETVAHASVDGVADAPGVLFAAAAALGVAGESEDRIVDAVRDRLQWHRQLLIIDGIEPRHRATALLARLLEGLPPDRTLVTSREPVGISGEVGYRLEGLDAPAGRTWREAPAARLFLDAARRTHAAFSYAPEDRRPLATLVEAIDGLPLGLVLAGSLVAGFSLGGIARIAQERPDAIGAAGLALPERHRSLERVLATSVESMDPERFERLVRCTAFAAPFDRHAAEAVAGASVSDLAAWTLAGWLHVDAADRWAMHGRVRSFLVRSARRETLDEARDRHARYHLDALRRDAASVRCSPGPGGVKAWTRALPELHAAFRAAEPDALGGAIEPMALLLDVGGRHAEAMALFAHCLARRPRALTVRAALHTVLAAVENRVGQRRRALRRARLACALARKVDDAAAFGRAARQAAEVAYDLGRYDVAEAVLDGIAAGWSRLDPGARVAMTRLRALIELGRSRSCGEPLAPSAAYVARVERARAGFERCLTLARTSGDVLAEGEALHDLGYCHYAVGDFATALAAFRLAERRHRAIGARRRRTIEVYWIGVASTMTGDHDGAERSLRAALRAFDEAGELPKVLEVVQAIGLLWMRRGERERAAACYLAALATPGLDARVRQAIETRHIPPLRAALGGQRWTTLEAMAPALGYRGTVAALLRSGSLPVPGAS